MPGGVSIERAARIITALETEASMGVTCVGAGRKTLAVGVTSGSSVSAAAGSTDAADVLALPSSVVVA